MGTIEIVGLIWLVVALVLRMIAWDLEEALLWPIELLVLLCIGAWLLVTWTPQEDRPHD